jgi:hypothetical protein
MKGFTSLCKKLRQIILKSQVVKRSLTNKHHELRILRLYIHTIHALSPKGQQASQIFLRDAHILPQLLSYEEYYRQVVSPSPSDCSLSQMLLIL